MNWGIKRRPGTHQVTSQIRRKIRLYQTLTVSVQIGLSHAVQFAQSFSQGTPSPSLSKEETPQARYCFASSQELICLQ